MQHFCEFQNCEKAPKTALLCDILFHLQNLQNYSFLRCFVNKESACKLLKRCYGNAHKLSHNL